jgi:membrane protease YdiL (CAAX protease family)
MPHEQRRSWFWICLGVILAFGLPELHLGRILAPGEDLRATVMREGIFWLFGLTIIGYVIIVERRPLASIGLRSPDWKTVVYGLLAAIVMIATVVFIYFVLFPLFGLKMNQAVVESVTRLPLWFQILIFLRAGVVEEILYRGYPIERVRELTGSKWIATLLSIVVFTMAHLSGWGGPQLLVAGSGGVLFVLLYLWRRDLVCNMFAHFLVDLVGFLAAGAHH